MDSGVLVGDGAMVGTSVGETISVQVGGKTEFEREDGVAVTTRPGFFDGGSRFSLLWAYIDVIVKGSTAITVPATNMPETKFKNLPDPLFSRGLGGFISFFASISIEIYIKTTTKTTSKIDMSSTWLHQIFALRADRLTASLPTEDRGPGTE